jgi:hypothetical protein
MAPDLLCSGSVHSFAAMIIIRCRHDDQHSGMKIVQVLGCADPEAS